MTPWELILAPSANKDLAGLTQAQREAVVQALDRLTANPAACDIRKLRARDPEWRLRVDRLRVRFEFDEKRHVIRVLHVLPRGSAYKP